MKLSELTDELIKMDGRLSRLMALGLIIETIESELCIKPETLCELMDISLDKRSYSRKIFRLYKNFLPEQYKEIISESFEDLLPGFSIKANRNCIETKYFEIETINSSSSRSKYHKMIRTISGYGFKRYLAAGIEFRDFKAKPPTINNHLELYENCEWQGQIGQKYKGYDFTFLLDKDKMAKKKRASRKVVLAAPKKIEVFIKPEPVKPFKPVKPRFDITSILKPECHNILRAV